MSTAQRRMPWLALTALMALVLVCSASTAQEELADTSWQQEAMSRIRAEEYQIHLSTAAEKSAGLLYSAPNRAQGFRASFEQERVVLRPRTAGQASWEWWLALDAIGREGAMHEVGSARVEVSGSLIEYQREHSIEWLRNDAAGLEHGLRIDRRPAGESGLLQVELRNGGSLHSRFAADGQAVDLVDGEGRVTLSYAKLIVTDSRGERLESWMEACAAGIRLVVDDSSASYPLDIDPLLTSAAWSVAGDLASAHMGMSVFTAGDVNGDGYSDVIVGAQDYDFGMASQGAAFIFNGSPSGISGGASWRTYGAQAYAWHGHAVATAGDVNGDGYSDVIVGAYGQANPEMDGEGWAHVYHGGPGGPAETPDWSFAGGQRDARFGYAVATAGDVNGDGYSDVIIGADLYDYNGISDSGAAFLFVGSSSGLDDEQDWEGGGAHEGTKYGFSVATAGDVDGDGDD